MDHHSQRTWLGFAAATWSFIFCLFHLIWAAGWYVGLDAEKAAEAFAVPWKLGYDLVVAGVCACGTAVALALVQEWGRRFPRKLLGFIAWGGTILLGLRSIASMIQALYMMITDKFDWALLFPWELWFYLGAFLYWMNTWHFWHRVEPDSSKVEQSLSWKEQQ